jgi:metal-responsive CopG/Arc/MetJ family transcriptional regulator
MNINIYLEDFLAKSVNYCAIQEGKTRNAVIREAIKEWVMRHEVKQWPQSILEFEGIAGAPSFESSRNELLPPKEDPLI